jgi:hypothetical protein
MHRMLCMSMVSSAGLPLHRSSLGVSEASGSNPRVAVFEEYGRHFASLVRKRNERLSGQDLHSRFLHVHAAARKIGPGSNMRPSIPERLKVKQQYPTLRGQLVDAPRHATFPGVQRRVGSV